MSEITHQDYVELLRRMERLENIILSSSLVPYAHQEVYVEPGPVEKHIHKILVEGENERANS